MDANENTAPKSVKDKSLEELKADVHAADHYKFEQQEVLQRGATAKSELAQRLMQELNIKAGNSAYVAKQLRTINDAAGRNQIPPEKDIVLMAVVVDNSYVKEGNAPLDEAAVHSICKAALEEHLDKGAMLSSVSIQNTPKGNRKNFAKAIHAFTTCVAEGDKSQATTINNQYGVRLAFKPLSYMPEG